MINEETFSNRITRMMFVLSIFVIVVHSLNIKDYGWTKIYDFSNIAWVVEIIMYRGMNNFTVSSFFVISAYLFYRNLNPNDSGIYKKVGKKLYKRIFTLLIPYLIWNTLFVLFYLIVPRLPYVSNYMNGDALALKPSAIINGILFHTTTSHFWYLSSLIILTCLAPLFVLILRNKYISLLFFGVLVVGYFFEFETPIISCESIMFYFMGAGLSVYGKKLVEIAYPKPMRIIVSILYVSVFIIVAYTDMPHVNRAIQLFIPASLWIMLSSFNWKIREFQKQTFFMYVSHWCIVLTVNKLLYILGNQTQYWALFSYLLAIAINLSAVYLLYRILSRFAPKVYGVICGKR